MPHELANDYDDNTEKQKHRSSRHFDLVGNSRELCARDPRGMNYLWAVELTPVPNVVRKGTNVTLNFDHSVEIWWTILCIIVESPSQPVTLFIYDVGEQSTKTL